jgi:hypothetical protein
VYSRRKVAAFDCPEKIEVVDKILVHCLSGPMTVNRPILAAVRKGPSNLYYVGSRQLKTAARSTRDALHPSPAGKTGPVRAWMAWPVGEARTTRCFCLRGSAGRPCVSRPWSLLPPPRARTFPGHCTAATT